MGSFSFQARVYVYVHYSYPGERNLSVCGVFFLNWIRATRVIKNGVCQFIHGKVEFVTPVSD